MSYGRMSEDVYAVPDLTKKKVRHGQGEREVEMEERGENEEDRGEWEERVVDIYGTAEDFKGPDPDPGTNTAQEKHGDPDESKKSRSTVAAVCLGIIITLCLLLLAAVIAVVIYNMMLVKEKKDLTVEKDQLKISFEQLEIRHNNVTEERDQFKISFEQLQIRHNNVTEERDQFKISFEQLQISHSNLTDQKQQLETSFRELKIKYKNLTEDPAALKSILCGLHGFTFAGGLCYYISTETKNWDQSRQWCRDKQSDLMVTKSKEKREVVNGLNDIKVWLALTDRDKEGVWKWLDGTTLTTPTFWNGGEPNDAGGGEDCAETYRGGWTDRSCHNAKNRFICERVIY